MLLKSLVQSVLLALCGSALAAGELSFKGECEKGDAVFKPGEPMVFKVQLLEDGKPLAGKKLKWQRSGDDQAKEDGTAVSEETPLVVTTSTGKPGFVRIQVFALDDEGKKINDAKGKELNFDGGAGVGLESLQGYPEPKDFDAFWTRQKEELKAVPLKAEMKEVPAKSPDFTAFDVKVDCAGGKPVSGYLVKPKDAEPKSLQAQVNFMGYGVSSAGQDCQKGKITLSINAHGIENGREPEYYKRLAAEELKGYAFDAKENSDPETAYFKGMMLRVMRALEFVKSQPEWNGKDLVVSGGSQGGLQALSAAALDPDVTKCNAYKPWCCDLGGIKLERLRGWRPDFTEALGYFDAANQAKRIKCETYLDAGLGDYVCPPSSVTVAYNNLGSAKKRIVYIQGANHGFNPPGAQKTTVETK